MAYSANNPPNKVACGIGSGPAVWVYSSADPHTDVDAADYFTNGDDLGMKVNDVVNVIDTAAGATLHRVTAVTVNGAATVSAAVLA